jgi:hypothetical protein
MIFMGLLLRICVVVKVAGFESQKSGVLQAVGTVDVPDNGIQAAGKIAGIVGIEYRHDLIIIHRYNRRRFKKRPPLSNGRFLWIVTGETTA